jgi:hypothetical protein
MSGLRYTDRPCGYSPQGIDESWRTRFPQHSRSMDSAPMTSRPIKLYEPSGHARWGVYHSGFWREVQNFVDPRTRQTTVRMNGNLISNPVRWASS